MPAGRSSKSRKRVASRLDPDITPLPAPLPGLSISDTHQVVTRESAEHQRELRAANERTLRITGRARRDPRGPWLLLLASGTLVFLTFWGLRQRRPPAAPPPPPSLRALPPEHSLAAVTRPSPPLGPEAHRDTGAAITNTPPTPAAPPPAAGAPLAPPTTETPAAPPAPETPTAPSPAQAPAPPAAPSTASLPPRPQPPQRQRPAVRPAHPAPAPPTKAPAPPIKAPPPPAPLPQLTREVLRTTLLRTEPSLRTCVREGWGSDVSIGIRVLPSGAVQQAEVQGPLAQSATGRCLEQKIMEVRFPPFTKGSDKQLFWLYHVPDPVDPKAPPAKRKRG